MTVGLVTDSNAQLPPELVGRYGIEVVPLTVVVDGTPYLEGVELDADAFYARFAAGVPSVSTAHPSPGQFATAFAAQAARGADEVLAVLIGSNVSGTVNAARLAADAAPVPVRIVDSGTASFGIACCVWEAGEALATGADVDQAAAVAETVAATVGNVFTVGALELARAGGRLVEEVGTGSGIPVLSLVEGTMRQAGEARDVDDAVDLMAGYVRGHGTGLRVAVGVADAAAGPLGQALETRLSGAPQIRDLVRYRVGPSVGVHTGPGTAGAFCYPARLP
ncbi:MAG: DegV family protein [Acidimicrobiales bacterium]